ncbi:MAG: hypothetical protein AAGU14_09815, partial [Eubacteriaceae bacterium]
MNFIDWLIKKQQEEKQKQQQQQQQEAQAYDKIMSTGAGSEKYKAKKQVQQQNAKIKAQNDAIKKSNEKLQSDLAAEADKQGMNANEKMYYTQTQYMQRENKTKVPYKTMRDYRSNQIDFVDKDLGEIMKNDPEAQKKIEAGNALNVYLNGGQTYDESIALGEGWKDTYMTQFRDSLSPEELKKLSYLLGEQQLNKTDHAQTIKDYTKTIEYRAGQAHEDKKYASGDYKTGNFYANSAAQGAVSGTIGGFNKFIKRLSGDITPTVMLAEEKAYQKELSEAKGFKRIAGLTINSAAQMATSGGTGGMFASVAGNTYDQSRKQGYNDSESLTYALINAGMETVTTKLGGKMLGGYKGFVKGVPEIKETISKVVKNPIAQRCAFLITDMGAEGVEETLQTAFDPLIRNTVFKENNNLVLSGKDYLESFLVGALSVGALHAKSTAIGLSSDVIGSIYKMKNSKGQHLPNETVKAYLLNNATDSDIQKIDTWGKDIKAEDIDKMTDDLGRIASAKIGSLTYGDISKATAKMDKGQVIDFYYQVMNSPEYKSQTEEMKKQSAVAMDEGEGVKVNTTLDNLKSNIEITDNTLNKTVSNINENTNKEDVINNETLTSSQNNSIDTDSGISENSQVINDAADNVKTDNQANNTGINAEGKTNYS